MQGPLRLYLQHLFHLPKKQPQISANFFSVIEDIVLIEFTKLKSGGHHARLRENEHLPHYRAQFEGNLLRFVRARARLRTLLTQNRAQQECAMQNQGITLSKFSLLAPSLRQQRALVLCLHRVIQTRFLTSQRAYFLRTVF